MPQTVVSRLFAVFLVLTLSACANALSIKVQGGAEFDPPPLAENMARVFFYRDTVPDESTVEVTISIDRREVGKAIPGGSAYVDIRPGTHIIGASAVSNGIDAEKRFQLKAGQTGYVAVQVPMPDESSRMGSAQAFGPQLLFPYGQTSLQALKRLRFYGEAKPE